jgi:hypothetical protein
MTCEEFARLIESKGMRGMTTAERSAVANHFVACPTCQETSMSKARAAARRLTPEGHARQNLDMAALVDRDCQDAEAHGVHRIGLPKELADKVLRVTRGEDA